MIRQFCLYFLTIFTTSFKLFSIPHYYCIAADDRFYHFLENLIGSIHYYDRELEEIAVYNLGLTESQIHKLNEFYKVTVNEVELTHPQLLTPILTSPEGRLVRGCFAWKHVVLKQALEKFPYALYLDAGVCIMRNPSDIFDYIESKGYFFLSLDSTNNIIDRITDNVIEQVVEKDFFGKKEIILSPNTWMQHAAVQGISRKIYDEYISPLYEYSKNIDLYLDNKTARLGYGAARHDQTLSSILIAAKDMKSFPFGFIDLEVGEKLKKVYCSDWLLPGRTHILLSKTGYLYKGGFFRYIKYKKNSLYSR